MICTHCRATLHGLCWAIVGDKTWCDCQHRGTPLAEWANLGRVRVLDDVELLTHAAARRRGNNVDGSNVHKG